MEQFYYAVIGFLLSVYAASRYYMDPEKLLAILSGLFVLLSLYIGLDIYMFMLYIAFGLLGYVVILYLTQEGVLEFNIKKEKEDDTIKSKVPYWISVLIAQNTLALVLFVRYYDALEL
jgi:hypothetical protein